MTKVHRRLSPNSTISFRTVGSVLHDHEQAGSVKYRTVTDIERATIEQP